MIIMFGMRHSHNFVGIFRFCTNSVPVGANFQLVFFSSVFVQKIGAGRKILKKTTIYT